jgi:hypothetical protein
MCVYKTQEIMQNEKPKYMKKLNLQVMFIKM